jgi:hypothetical protein
MKALLLACHGKQSRDGEFDADQWSGAAAGKAQTQRF